MSQVTFYRKYRSQTFPELVGQEHIVQTLQNAISHDRLSHAYIFSGPRGTGKTTTARILAKTLNCRSEGADPCLSCHICETIAAGHSVDVIEIDAASNTGVDNIRELNEQVSFTPVESDYKVYIIDEAHMLSTGAFNALLKTLEEPPEKTVFILATTEPQKIPVTIHSRCQSLHFRRLTISEITSQLQHIAQSEGMTISEPAYQAIAENSSGCMRDGISLLNQVYSFKGDTIELDDVQAILGSTSFDSLAALVEVFLQKDHTGTLTMLTTYIQDGSNSAQLFSELTHFFRNMIYVKYGVDSLLSLDGDKVARLKTLAEMVDAPELQHYFEAFSKLESELRTFPNPDVLLQVRFLGLMGVQGEAVAPVLPSAPSPIAKTSPPVQPSVSKPASSAPPLQTPPPSAPSSSSQTAKPAVLSGPVDSADLWASFLAALKQKKPSLFTILSDAQYLGEHNGDVQVVVRSAFTFFKEKLKEDSTRKLFDGMLTELAGKPCRIVYLDSASSATTGESGGGDADVPVPSEPPMNASERRLNDIVELFEGSVV